MMSSNPRIWKTVVLLLVETLFLIAGGLELVTSAFQAGMARYGATGALLSLILSLVFTINVGLIIYAATLDAPLRIGKNIVMFYVWNQAIVYSIILAASVMFGFSLLSIISGMLTVIFLPILVYAEMYGRVNNPG